MMAFDIFFRKEFLPKMRKCLNDREKPFPVHSILPESARMGRFTQIALLLAIFALASGDLVHHGRRGRRLGGRRQRQGRQEAKESVAKIQGGVDFSGCVDDEETGLCCVEKEETIKTIQKVRPKRLNLKLKRLNQNDYLIKDRKQMILK